jgi:metal-dependent hydrolase (beta-lactamase superfamily II)
MRSAEASKPPVIESLSVRVTIAEISALAPDVVIPMHCTGRNSSPECAPKCPTA